MEDDVTASGPHVSIRPSAAVELSWVLHAAQREDFRHGHRALEDLDERQPELLERARSFWDEGGSRAVGFMELLVLAHHGGLLFATDVDSWLEVVAQHAPSLVTDLPLRSESEADRRVVLQRMAKLRRSARLREEYGTLLDDLWRAVRPVWRDTGRRVVELACATLRDRLTRGEPWSELVRGGCDFGNVDRLVAGLPPAGELAVVPAYFTHKGVLLDLPGTVLVGVRPDTADFSARARSESLARRLKTLADPTRLAIVDQLAIAPRTVTELARGFGIAQPTASNHVKLLREAGLVTEVRDGPRRRLEVDRGALNELVDHLRTVVAPQAHD